jgi:hypothetical protein
MIHNQQFVVTNQQQEAQLHAQGSNYINRRHTYHLKHVFFHRFSKIFLKSFQHHIKRLKKIQSFFNIIILKFILILFQNYQLKRSKLHFLCFYYWIIS